MFQVQHFPSTLFPRRRKTTTKQKGAEISDGFDLIESESDVIMLLLLLLLLPSSLSFCLMLVLLLLAAQGETSVHGQTNSALLHAYNVTDDFAVEIGEHALEGPAMGNFRVSF